MLRAAPVFGSALCRNRFYLAFWAQSRDCVQAVMFLDLRIVGRISGSVSSLLSLRHPALLGGLSFLSSKLPTCIKIGNTIWEIFHSRGNLHFSRGWPTSF